MRRLALVVLVLGWAQDAVAAPRQAIESAPELLLVEVRTEPASPPFGVPFDLRFVLHLPRALGAVLSDTLLPSAGAESVGPGQWSEMPIPGDSVEIRGIFPVMVFQEGTVLLPTLELRVRPTSSTGGTGETASGAAALERRTLRLGAVQVEPLPGEDGEGALQPRPAAGVLGSEWSLWRILAMGAWSVAGVAAAGAVGVRLRREPIPRAAPDRGPREEALGRLQELREGRTHLGERPDLFYAGLTEVVRRFAFRVDPGIGSEPTSYELLERLEARWGVESIGSLGEIVRTAERVKFGLLRPGPSAAEADWERSVAWIRATPEAR